MAVMIRNVAVALGCVALAGAPAQAQNFISDALQELGLSAPNQKPIDYRERAPLVMPSGRDLPPPREGESVAKSNPNWPTDPDAMRIRKMEEEDNLPVTETWRYKVNHDSNIVSPEELRASRWEGAGLVTEPAPNIPDNARVSPEELRRIKTNPNAAAEWAKREPRRQRLTDPPPGYRSPSPNAPFAEEALAEQPRRTWLQRLNPF